MQVILTPPPKLEAETVFDKGDNSLTVTPHFQHKASSINLASVVIKGKSGRERRYVILLSARTAKLQAVEAKSVMAAFDMAKLAEPAEPDEPDVPEDEEEGK